MGKIATAWVAGMLLLGCAHKKATLPAPKDEPYRIGKEDVLEVSVWRDPELSRTLPVRPDGYISLPIAGEVKAEGHTTEEVAKTIKERLAAYVHDPRVTVMVREVHASRIFVTGEVARPGVYPLRGPVSVVQAIALAGGFTAFADRGTIVVIRPGKNGGRYELAYDELIKDAPEGEERQEMYLAPGDTVVIP